MLKYFNPNIVKFLTIALVIPSIIYFSFLDESKARSLSDAIETSASGMAAQSIRTRIITENIANSETIGANPNEEPYRRKIVFFENIKDKKTGAMKVQVKRIDRDNSEFKLVYRPEHPAANAEGYIRLPNVTRSLESMDLREAQRSYEANVTAIETTKSMMERSLDLMR